MHNTQLQVTNSARLGDDIIIQEPVSINQVPVMLLERLQTEFSVTGTALAWLRLYLSDRSQFVKLRRHQSPVVRLDVSVPQASVLGPLLFAVYCSPVGDIIAEHGVIR